MKIHNRMQSKFMGIAAALMVALVSAGTASADVMADCTYDGYVAMGGMVTNTTNSYLLPGNPDSPPEGSMQTFGYAFCKFDTTGLPTEAVTEAYLQLDVIALQDGMTWPATGTGNVGVFAVTADVAGINAGTAGTFRDSIADIATDSVSMTGEGLVYLDVTDIVNGWIAGGDNYGLVLASPGGLMPRLHASETTAGLAPVITNVPEPATMGLLACGALGLISRRKRNG
ncbi:MAG: DNRLRE domain-containing protein [Planctomycetes bacterium]|jgi:hypothetical protein|nr:DNRLRE domain-containing protein [Planctomycetota bacterium]